MIESIEMAGTKIRVRIAPSPTGFAHVGTAYVALFNYAFAAKNRGKFVFRLEDTDAARHVKGAEKALYKGLSWLNLNWHEGPDIGGKYGPYRQSERLDIYKEKVNVLLEKDVAYEDDGAIRFRNPGDEISWKDLVRGSVSFPGGEVTDFVLLKSDGYPTYNFAVVVDDILMKISHVIRGEEHISNTPRQLALYSAFNAKPPEFAHLPTLRNKERKKLSKRRDPVNLRIYQERGYLPEALVNFLCLLGWSHPEGKEIFSLSEFVDLFSIARVQKAGPIFNKEKLDWINGEYIRALTDKEFADHAKTFAPPSANSGDLEKIAPFIKTRIKKFSDFEKLGNPLFLDPGKPSKNLLKGINIKHLTKVFADLDMLAQSSWKENIDKLMLNTIDKNKFNTGEFFMSLRIAIFSNNKTLPVNDSMKYLGKDESLKRIKRLI